VTRSHPPPLETDYWQVLERPVPRPLIARPAERLPSASRPAAGAIPSQWATIPVAEERFKLVK